MWSLTHGQSHHTLVWGILSLLCVIYFFCLYGYRFLSGGKRQGGEILHACSTTIRTGLLPFWWSRSRSRSPGTKNALSAANTHLVHTNGMRSLQAACSSSGRAHFVAAEGWLRRPACAGEARQSELGAPASRNAVRWDLRLASLLTHLLVIFYSYCNFVRIF